MSVNRVILIGNLCKEVEIKYMTSGAAVANVSIACNETWKDKSGAQQESVEFVNLVFYRKLAEIAGEWLKKGQQVYVEGKLKTRSWEKDGVKRYATEVIVDKMEMLGGKREGGDKPQGEYASQRHESNGGSQSRSPAESKAAPANGGGFDNFDDAVPFRESCLHYSLWRVM